MVPSKIVPPTPAKLDVRDWVTPEDLNVAPALLGLPLARPSRRAWAMLLDLLIIATLSRLLANGWWLAALMVLGGAHTWASYRGRRVALWVWIVVAGLMAAGAYQAWQRPARPAEVAVTRAGDAVEAATAVVAEAAEGKVSQATIDSAARIAKLEVELAESRKSSAHKLRDEIAGWLDDIGFGYGWAMLYFSFVPAWWRGQTLGKRALGLRIVELTGKPMTVFQCLKRYGGYAAGMATGGLGFLQVLWDSNRQAIQDKTAHTVVIDLRNSRRLAPDQWQAPTR